MRHGSRYPGRGSTKVYKRLLQLAKKINATGTAELCHEDVEQIKNWELWYDPEWDKDISRTGYKELRGIASRFIRLFPEIFKSAESNPLLYRFFSTDTDRTIHSANAFMDELYNTTDFRLNVEIDEQLLHYFLLCKKYVEEISKNDLVLAEVNKFIQGEMQNVVRGLSERLGIPRNQLSFGMAFHIYVEGCIMEQWATGQNGAWCLAFSKSDLQKFEYLKDIRNYYTMSYEHEINHRQSCELKKFILNKIKDAAEGVHRTDNMKGHFTFAHYQTMATLMTEMKLVKDDGPYKADEFSNRFDRSFRTSTLIPGSANVAYVLYNCQDAQAPPKMMLQIFVNEKKIKLPPNSERNETLWDLEDALQYYNYYHDDCDFDDVCAYEEL